MRHEDAPKSRLATHFRKPKWEGPKNVARPLPPREVITVRRLDTTAPSARPRHVEISLWRIRAGEGSTQ